MISFEDWRSLSKYRLQLEGSFDALLEAIEDEHETTVLKTLKSWASSFLNKVKGYATKIPDDKRLDIEVDKLLGQLREKFSQYSKENYDQSLIGNFDFFKNIKTQPVAESLGFLGNAFFKGVVMVLKWMFISLADLVNASLDMLKHSLTGEGFFKLCVFWVAPAILVSPVMGLQAIYGISNWLGLVPFIGWFVWHVFVKPAIFKLSGAKRVPLGKMNPDDGDSPTVLGGWARPQMA
jgi:hypothetical protein